MAKKKSAESKKPRKPYVQRKTIINTVGGGFGKPGESKIVSVGKHRVLLTSGEKLNKHGNPIHTATVIHENGQLGRVYRGTGNAAKVVAGALRRNGVKVKSPRPTKSKQKKITALLDG
ncbi:MAG: hypothetical protein IJW60_03130 [Clostridia bacterium]|nr:hypothetical protein [Clostridia bacterium]